MYYSSTISTNNNRLITLASTQSRHNQYNTNNTNKNSTPQRKQYTPSTIGSKSYQDALQHSFNVASKRIYFNPDMTYFVTFTYKDNIIDVNKVLQDIKIYIKSQKRKMSNLEYNTNSQKNKINSKTNKQNNIMNCPPCVGPTHSPTLQAGTIHGKDEENMTKDSTGVTPKYVFILEKQKRGAIHVHMICNLFFDYEINKNGYKQLTDWKHGFTSVLEIKDLDKNFKPFLYLFKYMRKSERVGKSFVHSSRGLDNYRSLSYDDINLKDWSLSHKEVRECSYINYEGNETTKKYYKNYYTRRKSGNSSNNR